MLNIVRNRFIKCCLLIAIAPYSMAASNPTHTQIKHIVDENIIPIMKHYHIPGVAVAVTMNNKNYFFNYGESSRITHQAITNQTLFETGSVTKTFTSTLAAYYQQTGQINLSKPVSYYLPPLKHGYFDQIDLINLATHTSGLPLFAPSHVTNFTQYMIYLKNWRPPYPIGTRKIYSSNGIGLLGMIMAKQMQQSYSQLLTNNILKPLQLNHSYIIVPDKELPFYAQGYDEKDNPVRMPKITLLPAAEGLKSSSEDLIRYVQANMQELSLAKPLTLAILATHIGYYKTPGLTQDLMWEQYNLPLTLDKLLYGNGDSFLDAPAIALDPPTPASTHIFINKTGTSNGFGTYIAFIPSQKIGIVILANKHYPIETRVKAGFNILASLTGNTHFIN